MYFFNKKKSLKKIISTKSYNITTFAIIENKKKTLK